MQNQIIKLVLNLNFWSALSGFIGTILIFFFGLPPRIDPDGNIHLILEQTSKEDIKEAKIYRKVSYVGVFLLIISFLLQVILSIK